MNIRRQSYTHTDKSTKALKLSTCNTKRFPNQSSSCTTLSKFVCVVAMIVCGNVNALQIKHVVRMRRWNTICFAADNPYPTFAQQMSSLPTSGVRDRLSKTDLPGVSPRAAQNNHDTDTILIHHIRVVDVTARSQTFQKSSATGPDGPPLPGCCRESWHYNHKWWVNLVSCICTCSSAHLSIVCLCSPCF